MESFFGTLRAEYSHLNRFVTVEQLPQGVVRYIHYYNQEHIKMKIKGPSSAQHKTRA